MPFSDRNYPSCPSEECRPLVGHPENPTRLRKAFPSGVRPPRSQGQARHPLERLSRREKARIGSNFRTPLIFFRGTAVCRPGTSLPRRAGSSDSPPCSRAPFSLDSFGRETETSHSTVECRQPQRTRYSRQRAYGARRCFADNSELETGRAVNTFRRGPDTSDTPRR